MYKEFTAQTEALFLQLKFERMFLKGEEHIHTCNYKGLNLYRYVRTPKGNGTDQKTTYGIGNEEFEHAVDFLDRIIELTKEPEYFTHPPIPN